MLGALTGRPVAERLAASLAAAVLAAVERARILRVHDVAATQDALAVLAAVDKGVTMSRQYFGTDGVRGGLGQPPITPDFVMKLGYAAARCWSPGEHRPPGVRPAVIGKDTRFWLYAGGGLPGRRFFRRRVDVRLVGPCPPGHRLPDPGAGCRPGSSSQPPQSPRRQRHQVLLGPGHQAAR